MKSIIKLTLLVFTSILIIACDNSEPKKNPNVLSSDTNEQTQGNQSPQPQMQEPQQHEVKAPQENSIVKDFDINKVPGDDLTKASEVLKKINSIPTIKKIEAPWIYGEWYAYEDGGLSYKATFHKDGTYTSETTRIQNGKSSAERSSGKWYIYEKPGVNVKHLFLTKENSPFYIDNMPIEQEGPDGFRLLYTGEQPVNRSILYIRSTTNIAIYPEMNLIGRYHYLSSDYTEFIYTLLKDGTFIVSNQNNEYKGTWSLDVANAKLNIRLNGEYLSFSIIDSYSDSLMLKNHQNNEELYWEKLNEGKLVASVVNIAGEYQSRKSESYISIRKNSNGYLVDYYHGDLQSLEFSSLPATADANGDLHMILPQGHLDAGKEVILRAGYNRIIMLQGFTLVDHGMQKVSNKPIVPNNSSILGTWRNNIWGGHMEYISFFKNGTYRADDGYGKYSFDGTKLQMKKTCKPLKTYKPFSSLHTLELDVSYSQVPGLHNWGDEGSKINEILFKHDLDYYQTKNSPKLKPNPEVKGTYLFANETNFDALVSPSDFISYTFHADGKGLYHLGNIGPTYLDNNNVWRQATNSGLGYGINYFIVQEKGKEYIVYYPKGVVLSYIANRFNFIDEIKNKKDVRIVELYHRRTTICDYDSISGYNIVPLSKK